MTSHTDTRGTTGDWTTEWIYDAQQFATLSTEWDELHSRSVTATPFQCSAWLTAWWQSYGTGVLRLLLVRRGGQLVGGAPLLLERKYGVRVLSPVGRGFSDISEFLAVSNQEAEGEDDIVRELGRALYDSHGWDVLDLPEVRGGGTADRVAQAWVGNDCRMPASVCLRLPGRPVESILPILPRSTRRTFKRKLRIIGREDIKVQTAAPQDISDAVATLLRLHQLQWRGRGGNPEHLSPQFAQLLQHAVSKLAAAGAARVELYILDDRVQAAELLLLGSSFAGAYMVGVDPQLRSRVDVSTLLIQRDLEVISDLGLPWLDLLRGEEEYKTHWRPDRVQQERVLLTRASTPAAKLYVAAARARALARAKLVEHPQLHSVVTGAIRVYQQDGPVAALKHAVRSSRDARQSVEISSTDPEVSL